jgi:hypothetical protein
VESKHEVAVSASLFGGPFYVEGSSSLISCSLVQCHDSFEFGAIEAVLADTVFIPVSSSLIQVTSAGLFELRLTEFVRESIAAGEADACRFFCIGISV